MSGYTSAFGVRHVAGARYALTNELIWDVGMKGSGLTYSISAGYEFDVSIPKILQRVFSPHDRRFLKAAALHDHMLEAGWSRAESAAVFHEALKADGVPRWRRMVMFLAVAFYKYS
jgi:hypothetical protein